MNINDQIEAIHGELWDIQTDLSNTNREVGVLSTSINLFETIDIEERLGILENQVNKIMKYLKKISTLLPEEVQLYFEIEEDEDITKQ